ncbi:MAG TPA: diguanylate cyclase [Clostridiaceae bacterium]|nr:diguanylate cyclase [Clostridiaceae bacterium]
MFDFDNERHNKLYEIISIMKLFSLIVSGMLIYSKYLSFYNVTDTFAAFTSFSAFSLLVVTIFFIYEIWMFSTKRKNSGFGMQDIIEIMIFISIFTSLVIRSQATDTHAKLLFLFVIITSSIQFGIRFGIVIALVSSFIILLLDIIYIPYSSINVIFQNDLILVGVFVLTAWILGYYERIEREHRDKMTYLAIMDGLTEVYNHRYFQEALKNYINEAKIKNYPVSLALIDIDCFKSYNDLYGHQAGDRILKEIAFILKTNIRESDILARYGGEEFAIIMPKTDEKQALEIAERLRNIIDKYRFQGEENLPNSNLTISIGVSCYPDKAKSLNDLINSTDDALYRAKFFNKNRVETYRSVLEELKEEIDDKHFDLIASIKTLISVINAKDRYTYAHTERVVMLCELVAKELNFSEQDSKTLKYGAYLHDIGKIHISEEILNKKMPLSEEEWNILKQHPQNGVNIIKPIESLSNVIPLILHHHERYDGLGYPSQLKGEEIPYLARVLTVVDSFDAMTSDRPYRRGKSFDEAIEEIKLCSGTQFDPQIASSFIRILLSRRFEINKTN